MASWSRASSSTSFTRLRIGSTICSIPCCCASGTFRRIATTGNRTRVTETAGGVTREIRYTYDSLYRLTAADYSTGEYYGYQYDPVGNREVMTDAIGVHTYAYDPANRLTGIQLPNSSIQGYTWDNRGNLLADGTFTYTYSAAGRMVRAESITATLVYTYNADGLRVARSQSVASVESVDTFTRQTKSPCCYGRGFVLSVLPLPCHRPLRP